MKKKSIYLLAIVGTLIGTLTAGWVIFTNLNNDFSFEGLSLNLNSINQVGVYKNSSSPLGRRASSGGSALSANQNESYLVGYNNEGEQTPLVYLNDENQEVRVPYSVFSFEVVGDFSYIVYYNSLVQSELESLENSLIRSTVNHLDVLKSIDSTNFEILLKYRSYGQLSTTPFIILHNKSGKLFNAITTIRSESESNDGNYWVTINLFTPFENKIIYFYNYSCKVELVFDELDYALTKTEVCSTLEIYPIFVHETGYFAYIFDDEVLYASSDFSVTGNLTKYLGIGDFPSYRNSMVNNVFKSVGERIVAFSIKGNLNFVVFDGAFSLIEEKTEVFQDGVPPSGIKWLFNRDGYDFFTTYVPSLSFLYYFNFETLLFGSLIESHPNYSNNFTYLVFEGNLYEFGPNIRVLNNDNTFLTLEQNTNLITNSFASILKTGYVEYTQAQGLTQIKKSLNLQTGEIYLESESRPTITGTQVQPIN